MATYKGEEINTKPTEAMANNAKRGLEWREEFGRGGTEVGVARARDLINRRDQSPREPPASSLPRKAQAHT